MNKRAEEIEKTLSNFVNMDVGKNLRSELEEIYKSYEPKHESQFYLDFIADSGNFNFKRVHEQSINTLSVFEIFTVESQHISGNSIEHCIDKYFKDLKC